MVKYEIEGRFRIETPNGKTVDEVAEDLINLLGDYGGAQQYFLTANDIYLENPSETRNNNKFTRLREHHIYFTGGGYEQRRILQEKHMLDDTFPSIDGVRVAKEVLKQVLNTTNYWQFMKVKLPDYRHDCTVSGWRYLFLLDGKETPIDIIYGQRGANFYFVGCHIECGKDLELEESQEDQEVIIATQKEVGELMKDFREKLRFHGYESTIEPQIYPEIIRRLSGMDE